jgi:hypothetical protein
LEAWWSFSLCNLPLIGLSLCSSRRRGKRLTLHELMSFPLLTQSFNLTSTWNSLLHVYLSSQIRAWEWLEAHGCRGNMEFWPQQNPRSAILSRSPGEQNHSPQRVLQWATACYYFSLFYQF